MKQIENEKDLEIKYSKSWELPETNLNGKLVCDELENDGVFSPISDPY